MSERKSIVACHYNRVGVPVFAIKTQSIPASYWGGPDGWIPTTFNQKFRQK